MKKLSVLILILQFILQPVLYAQSQIPKTDTDSDVVSRAGGSEYEKLQTDPMIEAFENAEGLPTSLGLDDNDPTLDEDPFFLKGQEWTKATEDPPKGEELPYTEDEKQVSISLPNGTWTLNAALSPILFNDEYIYFSAKENFDGFKKASQGLDSPGEGIFVVSYSELLSSAQDRLPVPVYYVPLPEHGWQGKVIAVDFPQENLVALGNTTGDMVLPLRHIDLQDVIKAERMNLYLAHLYTAGRSPGGLESVDDLRKVIPDSKITAGFGVLFTGIDSKNPSNSLFAQNENNKILKFLKDLSPISKAQASGLDPVLQHKLIKLVWVVGLALVGSVGLRLWIFAKHYKEIRAKDPDSQTPLATIAERSKVNAAKTLSQIDELWGPEAMALLSPAQRVKETLKSTRDAAHQLTAPVINRVLRPVSEVGDIFASTLTSLNKLASIWFANTIEFLGDRYAPKLMAGENTVIRKFLSKNIYFTRGSNSRLPVTGKSWVQGITIGGIDTFFVYVQLYSTVPFLGRELSHVLPSLKPRIDDAYELNNPNIASIRTNEVARNASGYTISAATQMSGDLRSQLLVKVESDVRKQMLDEGLDPLDNDNEFTKRKTRRMDEQMRKMELPSTENFLFDATTLWAKSISLLGYTIGDTALNKTLDEEGKPQPDKFRGLSRQGLVISSVKQAIKNLSKNQDADGAEALALLKDARNDMNILGTFVKSPVRALFPPGADFGQLGLNFMDYLRRFRETRKSFVALTYEGPLEDVREFTPQSWRGASPAAVTLAATYFREALDRHLKGLKLESKPFAPEKQDFVGRWQERKAIARSSEAYIRQHGKVFNSVGATADETKNYQEIYATTLANILGLYPDYSDDLAAKDRVLAATKRSTTRAMESPGVQEYFSERDGEKAQYEADIYATSYINSYLEVVVRPGDNSPISASQPGSFLNAPTQKWRQVGFIKRSQVLTRVIRGLEAFNPSERFDKGRAALLDRSIPGYFIFKQSNLRTFSNAITSATAVYWFNYALFGMNLPPALWTLQLVAGWTIGAPSQVLNNLFTNQGWKPGGKYSMTVLFGLIYTWATFWGELPVQIFAGDFKHVFEYAFKDHLQISLVTGLTVLLAYQTIKNRDRILPAIERAKVSVPETFRETAAQCRAGFMALRYRGVR